MGRRRHGPLQRGTWLPEPTGGTETQVWGFWLEIQCFFHGPASAGGPALGTAGAWAGQCAQRGRTAEDTAPVWVSLHRHDPCVAAIDSRSTPPGSLCALSVGGAHHCLVKASFRAGANVSRLGLDAQPSPRAASLPDSVFSRQIAVHSSVALYRQLLLYASMWASVSPCGKGGLRTYQDLCTS